MDVHAATVAGRNKADLACMRKERESLRGTMGDGSAVRKDIFRCQTVFGTLTRSVKSVSVPGLLTAVLLAAIVPIFLYMRIPFNFPWVQWLQMYWIGLAAQSMIFAGALSAFAFPPGAVLLPALKRYSDYRRATIFAGLIVLFYFLFSLWIAILWAVVAFIVLEFCERTAILSERKQILLAMLEPAAYLFLGLFVVIAYNHVAVTSRFQPAHDQTLAMVDHWLLMGHGVSQIAHVFVSRAPRWVPQLLAIVYLGMMPQIGAAMILTALLAGKETALRFVDTLLTAYYIALVIFFIWPTHSPYFTCSDHFAMPFPPVVLEIQKGIATYAAAAWKFKHLPSATGYYIAFPCMHIALPLIALWFLRRWKRIAILLIAYDLVLIPAILLLEWHYVTDLIGGTVVAVISIALNECWTNKRRKSQDKVHSYPVQDTAELISRDA